MDKFVIEESIGFIIARTAMKMKNYLGHNFKQFDITPEQWGILNRLWLKDGISQKELAELAFKDQPNITRILDKLEEKGLITRQVHPEDRRAFLVYLTEPGCRIEERLVPIAVSTLDRALCGFSQEEIVLLKSLLNRINTNLD